MTQRMVGFSGDEVIRTLLSISLKAYPAALKKKTLLYLSIEVVEDLCPTVSFDGINTIVTLVNPQCLLKRIFHQHGDEHPVRGPVTHDQDLLPGVDAKDSLHKR